MAEFIGGEMRLMVAPLTTLIKAAGTDPTTQPAVPADPQGIFTSDEFKGAEDQLLEIPEFTELTTADPTRPETASSVR